MFFYILIILFSLFDSWELVWCFEVVVNLFLFVLVIMVVFFLVLIFFWCVGSFCGVVCRLWLEYIVGMICNGVFCLLFIRWLRIVIWFLNIDGFKDVVCVKDWLFVMVVLVECGLYGL